MKIILVESQPEWKEMYEKERKLLKTTVFSVKDEIKHIGSTSISGIIAKPIVDIMVGLHNFSIADELISTLESLRYEYVSKFEDVLPDRRFFIKRRNGLNTHHLHVVEIDSEFWKRHLLFRDFLRLNSHTAKKYESLKSGLSEIDWEDPYEYTIAKGPFIRKIENEAHQYFNTCNDYF